MTFQSGGLGPFEPLPDYMSGINDAFARNEALGRSSMFAGKKKKNKLGKFLEAFAGTYGDALTGNPVYSQSVKSRQDAEAAERDAQAQKDWWYEQQRYKAENERPDLPGIIDEFKTAQSLGMVPPDMRYTDYISMRFPGASSPVILPHNVEPVGGGGSNLPRVSGQADYDALPPGAEYLAPDGTKRKKVGGQTPQASGNFPRPY